MPVAPRVISTLRYRFSSRSGRPVNSSAIMVTGKPCSSAREIGALAAGTLAAGADVAGGAKADATAGAVCACSGPVATETRADKATARRGGKGRAEIQLMKGRVAPWRAILL